MFLIPRRADSPPSSAPPIDRIPARSPATQVQKLGTLVADEDGNLVEDDDSHYDRPPLEGTLLVASASAFAGMVAVSLLAIPGVKPPMGIALVAVVYAIVLWAAYRLLSSARAWRATRRTFSNCMSLSAKMAGSVLSQLQPAWREAQRVAARAMVVVFGMALIGAFYGVAFLVFKLVESLPPTAFAVVVCSVMAIGLVIAVLGQLASNRRGSVATYLASKSCGACGRSVSLWSSAGERCPHCGAYWGGERSTTSSQSSSWASQVLGTLVVATIIGVYFYVLVWRR